MWALFKTSYGPSYMLWQSLDLDQRDKLDDSMAAVWEAHRDGAGINMERRYILVTGSRKA